MNILVTGAAGFIGFHLSNKLLQLGHTVVGIDNINDYYDVNLKFNRLNELGISKNLDINYNIKYESELYNNKFIFIKLNIEDRENLPKIFDFYKFDVVCNLAAQAGVRYSIENPFIYAESNIIGFLNILENCRNYHITKLVYASSSSVYGLNEQLPFSPDDKVEQPISLYAATKKSNELMSHTYAHLFGINTIGLRFFTVYGPWGRPDMAMFLFTDAIINGKPIKIYNNGELYRDFTYIDDIINGINAVIIDQRIPKTYYNIHNIGNGNPIKLTDFISAIENFTNINAIKEFLPLQQGDLKRTWANISSFQSEFNFEPKTDVNLGVKKFIEWYLTYYKK
jgi:UDP-glucuronate 4-epimerase